MLNMQTHSSELTQRMADLSFKKDQVLIFLFSPRNTPEQVVRPQLYNFTEGFMNTLQEMPDMDWISKIGHSKNSPHINHAITPKPSGIPMNMYTWSMRWTFALIIDTGNMIGDPNSNSGFRQIITGICMDEPLNPTSLHTTSPTLNYGAVLQSTHSVTVRMEDKLSGYGQIPTVSTINNIDLVPGAIAAWTPPQSQLCLMNAGDLAASGTNLDVSIDNEISKTVNPNACNVSQFNNRSGVSDSRQRSPIHHLYEIGRCLDGLTGLTNPHAPVGISDLNGFHVDTYNMAKSYISSNLSNHASSVNCGFDTGRAFLIQELTEKYPRIDIIPICQHNNAPWEARPQDIISPENIMSSLVVSVMEGILADHGLLTIEFRYNSYMRNDTTGFPGIWHLLSFSTAVPMAIQQQEAALCKFRNTAELTLFPALKSAHGDFDLIVHFDMTGDILVDLHYKDYTSHHLGGMYETSGRFGGITTPLLGSSDDFAHNASSLMNLVGSVATQGIF